MIGIIAAMPVELEEICKEITDVRHESAGGINFTLGSLNGHEVVAAVSGIGKVNAAMCTQAMILTFSPRLVINTGVAGSLSKELSVYDVAVATDVVEHDMDTTPLGDPPGFISGPDVVKMPACTELVEALCAKANELGTKLLPGTVASGDVFVCDRAVKNSIAEKFGAVACEMEGAAIGHVCYINKVPFMVIRSISDSADDTADVSFSEFCPVAASVASKIVKIIVDIA